MTLRTIKIFIAVAEEKNTHAAAKRLFISQPSVSQAIADLEQEYHVKLFERLSQRLYITETGEKLLGYAYHLLRTYDDIDHLLTTQGRHRTLHIGASVSVGTCLLDTYLDKIQAQNPDISVRVTVNNTSHIAKLLLESQLDAGVVEGEILDRNLICHKVCDDELVVVASPTHPLASVSELTVQDLAGQLFISRESGSNDRNQFEKFLRKNQIEVTKAWTCTNTQAIENAVIHGRGLAVLSRMLVQDKIRSGLLVEIRLKDIHITRDIRFVFHKDKYISDELRQFASVCGVCL